MSAVAIVGIVSVGVVLLIAVLGFVWRNLVTQIAAVTTAAAKAHARIESNIKEAVTALTERIDGQAATIDRQRVELTASIDQQRAELTASIDRQRVELTASIDRQRVELTASIDQQRAELTATIDQQTDRIVEVHRDLRGLGERIAKVEAARP